MGAKLIKGYNLDQKPIFLSGSDNLWEVYSGVKEDSSKMEISAFILNKSSLDQKKKNTKNGNLFTFLKREAHQLARLRHPLVLSVLEPLTETPQMCGFVTERVIGNLSHLIETNNWVELCGSELEIKIHLLELIDCISFLHNDAKFIHNNINPSSIYLTAEGKWKLSGFNFSSSLSGGEPGCLIDINCIPNQWVLPTINYIAPELLQSSTKQALSSDIYSIGCLIYTLFSCFKNKKPSFFNDGLSIELVKIAAERVRDAGSLSRRLDDIPNGLRDVMTRMLNWDPDFRPRINELAGAPYFYDPYIQIVKNINSLKEKEFNQQQNFLNSLGKLITKFERKIIVTKLIPALTELLFFNPQLSPYIVQIYLILLKQKESFTKADFIQLFWPPIKNLCKGKEIPAKTLYLVILHLKTFLNYLPADELQEVMLPLVYKCYDCGVPKIQALAIRKTEAFISFFDYNFCKGNLYPRILALCLDNNIEIRKWALLLILKKSEILDRKFVCDHVLAMLERTRKLENNPEINLICLKLYQTIAPMLGTENIANKLLASMIPTLLDINLSKQEFNQYYTTITSLLQTIYEERLPTLNQGKENECVIDESNADDAEEASVGVSNESGNQEKDFEFLSIFGGEWRQNSVSSTKTLKSELDFTNFSEAGNTSNLTSFDSNRPANKTDASNEINSFNSSTTIGKNNSFPKSNQSISGGGFTNSSTTNIKSNQSEQNMGGTKISSQNQINWPNTKPNSPDNDFFSGIKKNSSKNEFDDIMGSSTSLEKNNPSSKPPPIKFQQKPPSNVISPSVADMQMKAKTQQNSNDFLNLNPSQQYGNQINISNQYGVNNNQGMQLGGNNMSNPYGFGINQNIQYGGGTIKNEFNNQNEDLFNFSVEPSKPMTNMPSNIIKSSISTKGNNFDHAFAELDMDLTKSSNKPNSMSNMTNTFNNNNSQQTSGMSFGMSTNNQINNSSGWSIENEFDDYLKEKESKTKATPQTNTMKLSSSTNNQKGPSSSPLKLDNMFSNMNIKKSVNTKSNEGGNKTTTQMKGTKINLDSDSFFDNL